MTTYAKANPSKRFFIEMITRDLSLEDAVLDLIDNSMDALIRKEKIDISSEIWNSEYQAQKLHKVKVTFTNTSFCISDNCGGIEFEKAKNDVFRFGRDEHITDSRLSVYGIGLKRAIFKLGKQIKIESKTLDKGFCVNIDVEKWQHEHIDNVAEWQFPMKEINPAQSEIHAGTTITVTDLKD